MGDIKKETSSEDLDALLEQMSRIANAVLTPEQHGRVKALFKCIDEDDSGTMETAEIVATLSSVEEPVATAVIDLLFANDERISLSAWMEWNCQVPPIT